MQGNKHIDASYTRQPRHNVSRLSAHNTFDIPDTADILLIGVKMFDYHRHFGVDSTCVLSIERDVEIPISAGALFKLEGIFLLQPDVL